MSASDVEKEYAEEVGLGVQQAFNQDRDVLARSVDSLLITFGQWRRGARNSLWASVVLILAACGVNAVATEGLTWATFLLALILIAGAVNLGVTVREFRLRYRPLLLSYRGVAELDQHLAARWLQRRDSQHMRRGRVRYRAPRRSLISRKLMAKRRPPVVNDTFGELYLGAITTDLPDSCCI